MRRSFSFSSALVAVFLALAIFFGGAWATASAARGALPGDSLYSVKTALEDAQVALSRDAADDAQLQLEFARKRLDEIAELIEAGRFDDIQRAATAFQTHIQNAIESLGTVAAGDPARAQELATAIVNALARYNRVLSGMLATVPDAAQLALQNALDSSEQILSDSEFEFTGTVVEMSEGEWTVDERIVLIADFTEIEGLIEIGHLVKVHALQNADGTITAREIEFADMDDIGDDNANDNANDNGDDNANDNGDDNANDNGDDNANDNGDDNANDNGDDDANDNGDDDNRNGNANDDGDDNANDDDDGDDNANDDDGDDNANDNGDDNANDNDDDDDDNANDNNDDDDGDKSKSDDNSNDNDDDDDHSNSNASGGDNDNDDGDKDDYDDD